MPDYTGVGAAALPRRTAGSMSRTVGALWLCAGAAILFPGTLPAEHPAATAPATQETVAAAALTADIPPQPLAQALEDLARQTGLQYVSVDGA